MRKQIELICDNCKKSYLKDKSEYNRNKKLNRPSYCSRSCVAKANPIHKRTKNVYEHLRNCSRTDEFTLFRYLLKTTRNNRGKESTLSLEDIKEVWENQKGLCAYTNLPMICPTHTKSVENFKAASVDRVDSSKGYTKDNIHLVIRAVNYMKNNSTHEETVSFIELIRSGGGGIR